MAELIFNQAATPATPASGKDSLFVSNETPERLKRVDSSGNVWINQEFVLISNTADYTLSDSASAQKVFNGSTNGQITLPGSTSWQFDALYLLTNTGTTSHNWAVLFGGTATLTSISYWAEAYTATSNALSAVNGIYATSVGALTVTGNSSSATENVAIKLSGIMRINAAGTVIPQLQASAQPNGTEKILMNSYFRMSPFGSNTTPYVGNWS